MKRITDFFLTVCLCVLTAFAFVSCGSSGEAEAEVLESTEAVLVIRVNEVEGDATLYDVVKGLKKDGKIDFVSEDGPFGQSIVRINGVENASDWSWYWASYTTDSENGTTEIEYDGKTWYYAAAGISYLPVKAGESYMFMYIKYVA